MSLKLITNKSQVFAKLGTFWSRTLAPAEVPRARLLSRQFDVASFPSSLMAAMSTLSGETKAVEKGLLVTIKPGDVLRLGVDLNQRIVTTAGDGSGQLMAIRRPSVYDTDVTGASIWDMDVNPGPTTIALTTENCEYLLYPVPEGTENTAQVEPEVDAWVSYLLPIPKGVKPLLIQAPARVLVVGIDFYAGDGFIRIWDTPGAVFPDNVINILSYQRILPSWFNFTLQIDQSENTHREVAKYYRHSQSAAQFEKAIAEVAGMHVLKERSEVVSVLGSGQGRTTYIFDNGLVDINYDHTPLVEGTAYEAGTIIGDGIRILTGECYRQLDWAAGLALDALCPFVGLVAPDANCRFEAHSQDSGSGKLHVRPWLQGDTTTLSLFWEYIRAQELRTGVFLNDVLGITAVGLSKFINPIDFYFTHLLNAQAWLMLLRSSQLPGGMRQKALDFIQQEKPIGCIPIIIEI